MRRCWAGWPLPSTPTWSEPRCGQTRAKALQMASCSTWRRCVWAWVYAEGCCGVWGVGGVVRWCCALLPPQRRDMNSAPICCLPALPVGAAATVRALYRSSQRQGLGQAGRTVSGRVPWAGLPAGAFQPRCSCGGGLRSFARSVAAPAACCIACSTCCISPCCPHCLQLCVRPCRPPEARL